MIWVRLAGGALAAALALSGCSGSQAEPSGPGPEATRPISAIPGGPTTATSASTAASATAAALKPGQLPTDCAAVTIAARLSALEVATAAQQTYQPADKSHPMPTDEAGAVQEGRVWPGLFCRYPAGVPGQEAMVQVMPDTSAFFTTRQTTTCKPTFGKGERVALGPVPGWYCPTTNESAIEWVSYVRDGRIVVVSRLSRPVQNGPYRAQLAAYATELATRL